MEIKWTIFKDKDYIHLKYYGDPDFETWAEVMEEIFKHPDYRPGMGFVAVLTESGAPDAAHLRSVKNFILSHQKQLMGAKWANVTTERPVHYGMTRMAQVFIDDLPAQINAFQSEEEAIDWIAITP